MSQETALLLLECHCVDIVKSQLIAFGVSDRGVNNKELLVRVGLSDLAAACEVEARKYEYVIVTYKALNCADELCEVGFLDVSYCAVTVICNESLDAVIAVLIERAVIYTRGCDDADLETACISCCSAGICRRCR